MDEYEYACEWHQSPGNWISSGWHQGSWTTLEKAFQERDMMLTGIWKPDELRIVKRRKPGLKEVVE